MEASSFGAELIFNGLGGGGATGSGDMRFRTHSDWSTSEWGNWRTVLDNVNYPGMLDGRYVKKSGDTMTGNLTINATLFAGSKLRLWSDGEGGNIRFITPGNANNIFEFDNCGNVLRLYYCTDGGTGATGFQSWTWGTDGSFTAKQFNGYLNGNAATASGANVLNINNAKGLSNCLQYLQASFPANDIDSPGSSWYHVLKFNHGKGDTYYKRLMAFSFWGRNNVYTATAEGNGVTSAWSKFWLQGDSVTGAVWNDYAECRRADSQEPGYVMTEVGDDSLVKTTQRLQHFAGVVSDTWGFSQGETDEAKTNIAVAGRVLVYPYQDRNNYQPGDCVCAAPGGTVDIMTREEIIRYPDRIVGTVSCVPNYEEWGGGELADRDPVKVNGRIWIKVK